MYYSYVIINSFTGFLLQVTGNEGPERDSVDCVNLKITNLLVNVTDTRTQCPPA